MSHARKPGFTLVELLVVIAIIGILVSLLLPAVQGARESGRRATCSNNVKQLALAVNLHREKNGAFPTGGWGWGWAGEPDQGFTRNQPGGWAYSILPYMDQVNLWEMGRNSDANKKASITKRMGTPLSLHNCPTRRKSLQYPYVHSSPYYNADIRAGGVIARTDYAINGGDQNPGSIEKGPSTISAGLSKTDWHSDSTTSTGVCYLRSEVRIIPDGETNTYLIGERYCNPDLNYAGTASADDQGWDLGYDWDTIRWGKNDASVLPIPDTPGSNSTYRFGSAHTAGWNVSFCDGSVKLMSYSLDPATHQCLANRKDGTPIDQSKL